jgi:hypothetical protein
MFRVPDSGNGGRPRNYSSVMPLLGSADPGGATLDGEIDPPAAAPNPGPVWRGGGGRWRLWPLRVALWSALLIIAYRGITAIVFNQASAAQPGAAPAGSATPRPTRRSSGRST